MPMNICKNVPGRHEGIQEKHLGWFHRRWNIETIKPGLGGKEEGRGWRTENILRYPERQMPVEDEGGEKKRRKQKENKKKT